MRQAGHDANRFMFTVDQTAATRTGGTPMCQKDDKCHLVQNHKVLADERAVANEDREIAQAKTTCWSLAGTESGNQAHERQTNPARTTANAQHECVGSFSPNT